MQIFDYKAIIKNYIAKYQNQINRFFRQNKVRFLVVQKNICIFAEDLTNNTNTG